MDKCLFDILIESLKNVVEHGKTHIPFSSICKTNADRINVLHHSLLLCHDYSMTQRSSWDNLEYMQ